MVPIKIFGEGLRAEVVVKEQEIKLQAHYEKQTTIIKLMPEDAIVLSSYKISKSPFRTRPLFSTQSILPKGQNFYDVRAQITRKNSSVHDIFPSVLQQVINDIEDGKDVLIMRTRTGKGRPGDSDRLAYLYVQQTNLGKLKDVIQAAKPFVPVQSDAEERAFVDRALQIES